MNKTVPTDMITHTTAFVTLVEEHWLQREIAQWVHPMKDRSDDPSHHGATSRSCHEACHRHEFDDSIVHRCLEATQFGSTVCVSFSMSSNYACPSKLCQRRFCLPMTTKKKKKQTKHIKYASMPIAVHK